MIAAGGVVVKNIDGKFHILLIIFEDGSGLGLPKGHLHKDESFEEAAIREVSEETGLTYLTIVRKLGVVTRPAVGDDETKVEKEIHLFLMKTDSYHHGKADRKYDWFEINEAVSKMGFPQEAEFLKKIQKDLLKDSRKP